VEFYREGWQPELVSPELALVDPVLREKLLSCAPVVEAVGEPPVLPAPALADVLPMRRGDVIAWTSVVASCATAFALVMLAHFQHSPKPHPTPVVAPRIALITTYTPPPAPTDTRSEAQKLELASLLRSPARDPFSRP
jgi:hypothetical protein